MYLCTQTQIKNPWATCNTGRPNYYQLPYINKPWHKSSDESATLNTLEILPRLAYCRHCGEEREMIGTKNTREGKGQGKEMMGGKRWVKRKERGREIYGDREGRRTSL